MLYDALEGKIIITVLPYFHRQLVQVPAQRDSLDLCMMGFLLGFQTSSASCIQVAFWSVSLVLSRWNRHSQQTIVFVVTHVAGFEVFQVRQNSSSGTVGFY